MNQKSQTPEIETLSQKLANIEYELAALADIKAAPHDIAIALQKLTQLEKTIRKAKQQWTSTLIQKATQRELP